MKNNHNLTEHQLRAASDQLWIDERQWLIARAVEARGEKDFRNFNLDWYDSTNDTAYRMRGAVMPARAFASYVLTVQPGEEEASRLIFDEYTANVRSFGQLHEAVSALSYQHTQVYLGTIIHEALGNLIADSHIESGLGQQEVVTD